MQSAAHTVDEYLKKVPEDRQEAFKTVRRIILSHLPAGYVEGMEYGMVSYYVPLEDFPDTYNKQPLSYIALASQKNYLSLYLMSVYGKEEAAFREAYQSTGKKLDMGKSCVRFKRVEDLPLDLIAKAVAMYTPEQFIANYKHTRNK